MTTLKDTIEYLEDQLAELKLENDRLYKENCELKEKLYYWTPIQGNFEKASIQRYLPLVSSNGVYDVQSLVQQFNSSEGVTPLFGWLEDYKEGDNGNK